MREYCLVRDDKIVYGPCAWNGHDFARKSAGLLISIAGRRQKVPIPMIPPGDWIDLSCGVRILLVNHFLPPYDPFYQVAVVQENKVLETQVKRVYAIRDRDLAEVRSSLLARLRLEANKRLKPTDWMVVRQMEPGGSPIPPAILEYRRTLRATCNGVEAALRAATTIRELKESIKTSWPSPPVPEEGGATTTAQDPVLTD